MMTAISAAAAAAMIAALLGVRAADTFSASFLFSHKIENHGTNQYNQDSCHNEIFHNHIPTIYSAFSFLFVL